MSVIADKLRVLVVDDSQVIRHLVKKILTSVQCEVITANDGFEALIRVVEYQPDLIFLDVMMPRLDGYDACAIIKNNSRCKQTPVILVSSKDGLFDQAKGRVVGCDGYITKPFSQAGLINCVKKLVGA